jgi:hypothetical protein
MAADIAALPFAVSFLLLGLITFGSVDLGRPGLFFVGPTPISIVLACCRFDISVSICLIMSFVSMTPPYAIIAKNKLSYLDGSDSIRSARFWLANVLPTPVSHVQHRRQRLDSLWVCRTSSL